MCYEKASAKARMGTRRDTGPLGRTGPTPGDLSGTTEVDPTIQAASAAPQFPHFYKHICQFGKILSYRVISIHVSLFDVVDKSFIFLYFL